MKPNLAGSYQVVFTDFQQFHKEIVSGVVNSFHEKVMLPPTWYLWSQHGLFGEPKLFIVETPFDGPEEKEATAKIMKEWMRLTKVKFYCFVTEAYMLRLSTPEPGEELKIPKSIADHPDRIEVLGCFSESETASISTTFEIGRKGWQRTLNNRVDTDHPSDDGRFVGLLHKRSQGNEGA